MTLISYSFPYQTYRTHKNLPALVWNRTKARDYFFQSSFYCENNRAMTKKPGIVWNYYNKTVAGAQTIANCKFCNKAYAQNATRMEKHLTRCDKCPDPVKEIFSIRRTDNQKTWIEQKPSDIETEWNETFASGEQQDMHEEELDLSLDMENGSNAPIEVTKLEADPQMSNEEWEQVKTPEVITQPGPGKLKHVLFIKLEYSTL